MEREFSRRTAIAAMAGAAGFAAVDLAAAAPCSASDDSELINLDKQVDAIEASYEEAARLSQPHWDAIEAWVRSQKRRDISPESYSAAMERLEQEFPLPKPDCDEITGMMDKPMRRIMALPAFTPAGLAVKARLVKSEYSALWEEPFEDLDWDKMKLRALVDSVLAFAERRTA
jgi:hypothetical protein